MPFRPVVNVTDRTFGLKVWAMTELASNPQEETTSGIEQSIREALSISDLSRCLDVLEQLVEDPEEIAKAPEELLRRLRIAAGRLSRPTRHERERVTKAIRRYDRRKEREADLELYQTTRIRDGRVPAEDREARELRRLLSSPTDASQSQTADNRVLNFARNCYVCKSDYTELHFFYDCMCPSCAAYNFSKRSQTANLDGRVALITGGRIKIGFYASLMLLRAGARVIVTTRFPHDAARRYTLEKDYDTWKDRLTLYGLDLRHIPSVERFAQHLSNSLPRLDFLINNAAQTVQRPAGFFAHLLATENLNHSELPEAQKPLLAENHALFSSSRALAGGEAVPHLLSTGQLTTALDHSDVSESLEHLHERDLIHFPEGRYDADGQQLDLRRNNSWRMKAEDVSTPELIEVHLVNAIAPFLLCSRLKSIMEKTEGEGKHIVNVSAMEGVFARYTKSCRHPHTNMAKASLNMLTRTSAKDYLQCGIHMNSVDTGWVTDEDPYHHAERKRRDYDFQPPLDAIDGAARVCDPIFVGHATGNHASGQLFKDYAPIAW